MLLKQRSLKLCCGRITAAELLGVYTRDLDQHISCCCEACKHAGREGTLRSSIHLATSILGAGRASAPTTRCSAPGSDTLPGSCQSRQGPCARRSQCCPATVCSSFASLTRATMCTSGVCAHTRHDMQRSANWLHADADADVDVNADVVNTADWLHASADANAEAGLVVQMQLNHCLDNWDRSNSVIVPASVQHGREEARPLLLIAQTGLSSYDMQLQWRAEALHWSHLHASNLCDAQLPPLSIGFRNKVS